MNKSILSGISLPITSVILTIFLVSLIAAYNLRFKCIGIRINASSLIGFFPSELSDKPFKKFVTSSSEISAYLLISILPLCIRQYASIALISQSAVFTISKGFPILVNAFA